MFFFLLKTALDFFSMSFLIHNTGTFFCFASLCTYVVNMLFGLVTIVPPNAYFIGKTGNLNNETGLMETEIVEIPPTRDSENCKYIVGTRELGYDWNTSKFQASLSQKNTTSFCRVNLDSLFHRFAIFPLAPL